MHIPEIRSPFNRQPQKMQSRIQGTFGAGAQVWVPKVPLFCKAYKLISFVSNLSKAGHLTRLMLNQMLYSRGKTQIS